MEGEIAFNSSASNNQPCTLCHLPPEQRNCSKSCRRAEDFQFALPPAEAEDDGAAATSGDSPQDRNTNTDGADLNSVDFGFHSPSALTKAATRNENRAFQWATAWQRRMLDMLVERNPDILGGTPVFAGTRVPVRTLMDHLEAGDRLDEFLADFPTVSQSQAIAVLQRAISMIESSSDEVAA